LSLAEGSLLSGLLPPHPRCSGAGAALLTRLLGLTPSTAAQPGARLTALVAMCGGLLLTTLPLVLLVPARAGEGSERGGRRGGAAGGGWPADGVSEDEQEREAEEQQRLLPGGPSELLTPRSQAGDSLC
jgi:hypothetical protein